jgi:hypothetical protein
MATKSELIKMLEEFDDDLGVVCMDETGGWDNIERIEQQGSVIAIIFGGGSPFNKEEDSTWMTCDYDEDGNPVRTLDGHLTITWK